MFQSSKTLTLEVYKLSGLLPPDERFAMVQQIRRAVLSVHLNVAEGASRKSISERKRFYEIARGSLIEVDTAIGVANELRYLNLEDSEKVGELIVNTFKLISGLINNG